MMSFIELLFIAAGVSMDAFAVSVCKGLSMQKMSWRNAFLTGCYFGGFQSGMPLLGYLIGFQFKEAIISVDHWFAFILLGIIGLNMIKESFQTDLEDCTDSSMAPKVMILLAVATSIDALAAGVTFAFLQVDIVPAISFIGIITFSLSILGVKIGNTFGLRYKSKAEFTGGLTLILMGIKILAEHLLKAAA